VKHALQLVLLAVVLVVAAAAWIAWTGMQAREELAAVQTGVRQARGQVAAGDFDGARSTVADLQHRTDRARHLTSDPVWSVAGLAPAVGDDVETVATLAEQVDLVADRVIAPVVDAAEVVGPTALQPVDGTIPLEPLTTAAPVLDDAVAALDASTERVEAIDADGLLGPVVDARTQLLAALGEAGDVLGPAAVAARLAPAMLGAEGARDYLMLFQNNAELRATGGMPGAFAVVRAEAGRLSVVSQGTAGRVTNFDPPAPGLPSDTARLFENEPAIYFQDVNFTADFATAASMARTMYALRTGVEVDGVLATDPVALSYLLGASGPIEVPGIPALTAGTAVDLLLHDLYLQLAGKPVEQDAAYAAAAGAVFATVTTGTADQRALLQALGRSVAEGRLMLWSADAQEQRLIAGTALGGPLRPAGTGGDPAGADASTPVVGVFLNGAVASKLDYYLRQRIHLSAPVCTIAGLTRYEVDVELTFTAPADAATSLPPDVLGPADLAEPGQNRVQVLTYAPPGGSFDRMLEDGSPKAFGAGTDSGRPVALTTVLLDPGETTTLTVEVLVPARPDLSPVLRTTPMAHPSEISLAATSSEDLPSCG